MHARDTTAPMESQAFRALIPHRPPMVLIDEVDEWGAERIVARRTVRAGDPFVTETGLDDAALLECIAQTIAAGDACFAQSKGGRVLRGYLTGLTGVEIHSRVGVGDTVTVVGMCLKRMDGMGLFEVKARVGARLVATGRFKLFVDIAYDDA
jgi:predicted hotdog family 3-hydroxylacyl-ACP dehydratase